MSRSRDTADQINRVDSSAANSTAITIDSSENVGIGTAAPSGRLSIEGATATSEQSHITFENTSGAKKFAIGGGKSQVTNNGFAVVNVTDNTSPLFIDDSGRVGLGNAAPNTALHVSTSTTTKSVVETTGSSSDALIEFTRGQGSGNTWSVGLDQSNASALSFAYLANGSPSLTSHNKMTLDSSGNLLVGMSSNGLTSTGIGLVAGGVSHMYSAGDGTNATLMLGRGSNDGNILSFNRSGSTVGSIGVGGGYLHIGKGDTGIGFASDDIIPYNLDTNATRDAAIDLGGSGYRFKDLHLSGGVVFGTGGPSPITSNTLDDYEEGTWTPSIVLGGLSVSTVHRATYVKVGQSVSVAAYFTVGGTGDNQQLRIGGLPYASASNGYSVGVVDFNMGGKAGAYNRVTSSNTYTEVLYSGDSPSTTRFNLKGNQVGPGYVILSVTYHIA